MSKTGFEEFEKESEEMQCMSPLKSVVTRDATIPLDPISLR